MIVKEIIKILDDTIYKNYSDRGVYIRNKTTGVLYSSVNSCIDYEYEETNIPIEKAEEEKELINNGRH